MDKEEVGRLAETYAPAVYRLAYARTGNRADAEDVMQEVFLTLLRKGPERFDGEEHAKAWLLRVTAQRANNYFRAVKRRREEPLDETVPAPESGGERELEAVLALPADLRSVVHLYYYEGLSAAETGRVLGIGEGAVKTRLFRARAKLREYLTEGGEADVP